MSMQRQPETYPQGAETGSDRSGHASGQVGELMTTTQGHLPAKNYGKGNHVGPDYPSAGDLIKQLNHDSSVDKARIEREMRLHPENISPSNPRSQQSSLESIETARQRGQEGIRHLSTSDLKTVGELAHAIKAGHFGDLQKIVDQYKDKPLELAKLNTALNLELEREGSKYSVAIGEQGLPARSASLTVIGPPQPDGSLIGKFVSHTYNTDGSPAKKVN
jgi:hypothetical protein